MQWKDWTNCVAVAQVSKVKGEECRKSTSSPNNSSATDRWEIKLHCCASWKLLCFNPHHVPKGTQWWRGDKQPALFGTAGGQRSGGAASVEQSAESRLCLLWRLSRKSGPTARPRSERVFIFRISVFFSLRTIEYIYYSGFVFIFVFLLSSFQTYLFCI